VFGRIGRFLCWVEFQLHASNVCLINSYLKPHFGGRRSVGAFSPSAFFLSQSHGEHGGVSEFPRASISAQTPLCALVIVSSCRKILTLICVGVLTSPAVFEISSQFRHTLPSGHAPARSTPFRSSAESS
jgi:hypothetical protein